jgi:hypothetical protein
MRGLSCQPFRRHSSVGRLGQAPGFPPILDGACSRRPTEVLVARRLAQAPYSFDET